METESARWNAASSDLEAAQKRQQAAQVLLEAANIDLKMHEAAEELAKHRHEMSKLQQEHGGTVHSPECAARRAALPTAEAAVAALEAARAEQEAAEGRLAAARDALSDARQTSKRAREAALARREQVGEVERELRALRDEHKACEALQAGKSLPAASLHFGNNAPRPNNSKMRKTWDRIEQNFVSKLSAASRLKQLDLDLRHSVFNIHVPQAVLDAIAKAPADIAELSLSFSAAPAIKKAVLALLSRVRDRVQHLAVKRVHEDMSCGGIFGQSWALDMEAEEVKAFWRLVEECAATKLTLGSEGKDTWLVRKGAYNFRKGVIRRVTELDVAGLPGGPETMLMHLLHAYGPKLRVLRLPDKLTAAEHPATLRVVAKVCPLLEELALCWGPGLHQLAGASKLHTLRLEGGKPAEADVKSFRSLAKQAAFVDRLERLTINAKLSSDHQPSVSALAAVAGFKKLKYLSVANFDAFLFLKDGKGPRMKAVLTALPLLEELELRAVGETEELGYIEPQNLPNLKVLSVRSMIEGWCGEPMSRSEASQWREAVDELRCRQSLAVHDRSDGLPDSDGDSEEDEEEERRRNECHCGVARRRWKRKHHGSDSEDYADCDPDGDGYSPECVC